MTYYLQIGATGGPTQIASNKGYGNFGNFVESLDAAKFPEPSHLYAYGWCQNLDDLSAQLMTATYTEHVPADVADIVGEIQGLLSDRDEDAACCTVTDGFGVDAGAKSLKYSPDQSRDADGRFGAGSIGPTSPDSDHAAAIIDQWATPATGSREGEYEKVRAAGEKWVNGAKDKGWQDLYDETQARLKSVDVEQVTAYRGIQIPPDHPLAQAIAAGTLKPGQSFKLEGGTLASWSESKESAAGFASPSPQDRLSGAKVGIVLERVIPAREVVVSYQTHTGLIGGERELIALNRGEMKVWLAGHGIAGKSESGLTFDISAFDAQRGISGYGKAGKGFNPDQPRVPAGSSDGGEFGAGGGRSSAKPTPTEESAADNGKGAVPDGHYTINEARVQVEDGEITRGPKRLVGRSLTEAHDIEADRLDTEAGKYADDAAGAMRGGDDAAHEKYSAKVEELSDRANALRDKADGIRKGGEATPHRADKYTAKIGDATVRVQNGKIIGSKDEHAGFGLRGMNLVEAHDEEASAERSSANNRQQFIDEITARGGYSNGYIDRQRAVVSKLREQAAQLDRTAKDLRDGKIQDIPEYVKPTKVAKSFNPDQPRVPATTMFMRFLRR